jgi:Cu-Zn family superoxide dismutase
MLRRAMGLALGTLALSAALSGCATVPQASSSRAVRTIALPAEIAYPEGVAVDGQGRVYVGSALDSTVIRMAVDGTNPELIAGPNVIAASTSANFPRALGLKVDALGGVWVIGGKTGQVAVVAADRKVTRIPIPREGSVLNDAVILPDAVYVTDTPQPILWRIPLSGSEIGAPEPWIDFTGTALAYGPGRNVNGIAADAAGKYLIVVQMDKGLLFRIDTATRAVTAIDIGGEALSNTDGLVLRGDTLYAMRQAESEVVTIKMVPDLSSGKVVSRFHDPALGWIATAAISGDELFVVNTQFNVREAGTEVRPFTLTVVPLERLGGK